MNATNFGIYYDDADYTAPALNHGDEAEHRFFLEHKGQTWLQLNVINSHPVSTGGYPRFFDEDIITGSVNLELEKAEQIKSVSLTVLGVAAVEGLARLRFLELTEALWTRRQQEDTPGSLVGHHSWPFSVKLPREVPLRLKDKADSTIYRLPPSFSEKGWNAMLTIEYRILVHVKMGMFSPDYTLAANLFVLPRTVADPRQKVSESGPPGPDIDPEGWVELPAIKVKGRGMTPGVQDPDITCTLAIAKPLTFSLGSPIPILLTLCGREEGVLDSQPAINVVLQRSLAVGAGNVDLSSVKEGDTFRDFCATASFSPLNLGVDGMRRLRGTLLVPQSLRPSFSFPLATLKYSIALLPFGNSGVGVLGHNETPLAKAEVTIVAGSADGVLPPEYPLPPPPYETTEQRK